MDSAACGHISVMTTSMSSVSVNQTLHDDGSHVKAWLSRVDWSSPPNTELASVILLPMGVRPTSRGRSGHSSPVITIKSIIIVVPPAFTSHAPWRRPWTVSRLNSIRSDGSTVNPVVRLRYNRILISCRPEQISDLHQASSSL